MAEQYLQIRAAIDIHNHVRTGSSGLEDAWSTLNYIHWQFAGILGLAEAFFTKNSVKKSIIQNKMLTNWFLSNMDEKPSISLSASSKVDFHSRYKCVSLGYKKCNQ